MYELELAKLQVPDGALLSASAACPRNARDCRWARFLTVYRLLGLDLLTGEHVDDLVVLLNVLIRSSERASDYIAAT